MDTPKILVLNSWADDWDMKRVQGSPENAYILNGLAKRGWKLTIIAPLGEYRGPEPFEVIKFRRKRIGGTKYIAFIKGILSYIASNLSLYKEGKKLLLKKSYNGIWGIGSDTSIALFLLKRKFGKPSVIKIPGVSTLNQFSSLIKALPYHYSVLIAFNLSFDLFIFVDDGSEAHKVAERIGIKKEKFSLLPNPYPNDWEIVKNKRGELRKKYNIPEGTILIGWASRFGRLKGIDFLPTIVKSVLEENEKVIFLIAGNGNLNLLKNKISNERVKFVGFLPHREMLNFFLPLDIFISTNIYANYTLPVIEASYLGIPVVIFDVGETHKAVLEGETGFLIPPFDIQKFVERILQLAENEKLRIEMGKKAEKFIRENHISWSERVEKEATLLLNVLEKR